MRWWCRQSEFSAHVAHRLVVSRIAKQLVCAHENVPKFTPAGCDMSYDHKRLLVRKRAHAEPRSCSGVCWQVSRCVVLVELVRCQERVYSKADAVRRVCQGAHALPVPPSTATNCQPRNRRGYFV